MAKKLTKIEFDRVRSFGDRLNVVFEFLRRNFLPLIKCMIIIIGPVIAVTGAAAALLIASISGNTPNLNDGVFSVFFSSTLAGVVAGVGLLLVYTLLSTVVYSYVHLYITTPDRHTFTVEEVWRHTRKHIFGVSVAWVAIVLGIIIGCVMLIVPGVYISIPLSFATLIMVMEKRGFWEAANRAFAVVKENWWNCFGFYFVLNIIQSVISYVFYIPLLIVFVFMTLGTDRMGGDNFESSALYIGLNAFVYVGQFFLSTITFVGNAFQYYQMVEERESTGLISRLAYIGQPVADDDEDF
ncbi:MAG: hypothetical protein MUC97_05595 [Bernardetiaceae bacterium]|nr:hypothetical protein [Bernardetiaceae bacterium]